MHHDYRHGKSANNGSRKYLLIMDCKAPGYTRNALQPYLIVMQVVLFVDELLAVLDKDALSSLCYALACEVVDGSILVSSVNSDAVDAC